MHKIKLLQFSLILTIMALSGLLLGCGPAPVASAAAELTEPGTITVVGRGQAFGTPDQAQATVGVEVFADTVPEAVNENEMTIQAIMKALAAEGVDPKDIQTSNYNVWAEQRYGDQGPVGIAGYRVNNQVNILVRDLDKLGEVLAAAIEAGANNISSHSLSIGDSSALEAEAREMAMENARERAAELARLGQVELGEIKIISELNNAPFPQIFARGGGGGAMAADVEAPSFSPGQLSYEVQIQVTFDIQ